MNYRKLRMNIINNDLDGLYNDEQYAKVIRICKKLSKLIHVKTFPGHSTPARCIADYQYLCE